jgi:diguanylate cyclase (GGDEF)-like protein/putative nucleotidyltransferase with HDIG domain
MWNENLGLLRDRNAQVSGKMGFRSIPRLAQVYLVLVCLLGFGAAVSLRLLTVPETKPGFLELGIFAALAVIAVAPAAYLSLRAYAANPSKPESQKRHAEVDQESQARLADLYLSTIKSLALAIDAKDQYTHQHILRVQRYAVAIAKHLGLTGGELEAVNTGALLHDIGKLGVPEYVLLKPGRLTDEEFAMVKKHPEIGASILDPVEFPWPVLPVVKYHHERWDGTGYPEGLKGEEIPLTARIMAVADVYDALTSTRSYRSAWTHEKAAEVIMKDAGTHFDPVVVQAFEQVIQDVIQGMAETGEGPLAPGPANPEPMSVKAGEAAEDIARTSSAIWAHHELTPTIAAGAGLADTVAFLEEKIESIFPGVSCVFFLGNPKEPQLSAVGAVGPNRDFLSGASTLEKSSLTRQVARSGQPYVGKYDQDDLLLSNSAFARWTPLSSAMIVPISCDDSLHGTINLYHQAENAFSEHDLKRMIMVAQRSSAAIQDALQVDQNAIDGLTGFHNLRSVRDRIDERCQSDDAGEFGVLCLDLNSFRAINDNFGHAKGDSVLEDVSELLRSVVGGSGFVARSRGDEFLIILDNADRERALGFAELIESEIAQFDAGLAHYQYGALILGASIGVACFPEDGKDGGSLLSVADKGMQCNRMERQLAQLSRRRGRFTDAA